jgi:hypothetical protein
VFHDLLLEHPGEYNMLAWLANTIPVSGTMTVEPGSAGGIKFEEWGYKCGDRVGVSVADADLAASGSVDVTLTSSSGDAETKNLTMHTLGYFKGYIQSEAAPANPGDGILQVAHGDQITAVYQDADNGTGSPAQVQDAATIDCQPPVFAGLASISGVCPATLVWDPASDTNGPIQYRIYKSQKEEELFDGPPETTWASYFIDTACMAGKNYYAVRAVDILGNEDNNNQVRILEIPGLFLPVIRR